MRGHVSDGEHQHCVRNLSVKPHGFVEWQPSYLGSDCAENVSAHGQDNNHGVNRENQTSTS